MTKVEGSCRCGDVRITASGDPLRVGLCHCFDCRKHHGTPFHASAIFDESKVTITGETKSYKERYFCPRCGSPVFSRTGNEVEINIGTLNEANIFTPSYELWTVSREDWLPEFLTTTCYRKNRD